MSQRQTIVRRNEKHKQNNINFPLNKCFYFILLPFTEHTI